MAATSDDAEAAYLLYRQQACSAIAKGTAMNRRRRTLCTLCSWMCVLAWILTAGGAEAATLTAPQAKDHVEETATVCDIVASATFAARIKGSPTFLNLGTPYPDQIFTAVIWGSDRPKFHQPEVQYRGKRLCVTGRIKMFRGHPEIIVKELSQISAASAVR